MGSQPRAETSSVFATCPGPSGSLYGTTACTQPLRLTGTVYSRTPCCCLTTSFVAGSPSCPSAHFSTSAHGPTLHTGIGPSAPPGTCSALIFVRRATRHFTHSSRPT